MTIWIAGSVPRARANNILSLLPTGSLYEAMGSIWGDLKRVWMVFGYPKLNCHNVLVATRSTTGENGNRDTALLLVGLLD